MIDVRGPEQFGAVSRECKQAARALNREMWKALNSAAKPLRRNVAQSAEDTLPRRGGLAREVAKARVTTRRTKTGIQLRSRGRYSLYHLNKGIIRHPGNKGGSTIQRTTPGYWDKPLEEATPEERRAIEAASQRLARRIDRAGV